MAVFLTSSISGKTDNLDTQSLIVEDRVPGRSYVLKFGRNVDIDTATVPEDLWNGGGVYAGFPTGAAEEFEVFSSSASANNLDVIGGFDLLLVLDGS